MVVFNVKHTDNAVIGKRITEILNEMNEAEKIPCTCDKSALMKGARCICIRAGAIQQAGFVLGQYLAKLRKELK